MSGLADGCDGHEASMHMKAAEKKMRAELIIKHTAMSQADFDPKFSRRLEHPNRPSFRP